jgi:hypothetical protein
MIHQIILSRFHSLRRAKIHPIRLTYGFNLFPGTREADQGGVEFGEIGFEDGGSVAGRVAGYEDWGEYVWLGGLEEVDHAGHFVEFFGADVGAVGEAEIDLFIVSRQFCS